MAMFFTSAMTLAMCGTMLGSATFPRNGVGAMNGPSVSKTILSTSVALTTSGQIIIGGSSGPAAATLTAGSGMTITNGDGSITLASSGGVSAGAAIAYALVFGN